MSGEEQQSGELSNRRSDLSLNTKEMIANMYRNFTAKAEDDRMLHSITPRSSYASSEYSNRSSSTFNFSSHSRQLKNTQARSSMPSMVGSVIDPILETEQFSEIDWGRTVESFIAESDEFSPRDEYLSMDDDYSPLNNQVMCSLESQQSRSYDAGNFYAEIIPEQIYMDQALSYNSMVDRSSSPL